MLLCITFINLSCGSSIKSTNKLIEYKVIPGEKMSRKTIFLKNLQSYSIMVVSHDLEADRIEVAVVEMNGLLDVSHSNVICAILFQNNKPVDCLIVDMKLRKISVSDLDSVTGKTFLALYLQDTVTGIFLDQDFADFKAQKDMKLTSTKCVYKELSKSEFKNKTGFIFNPYEQKDQTRVLKKYKAGKYCGSDLTIKFNASGEISSFEFKEKEKESVLKQIHTESYLPTAIE